MSRPQRSPHPVKKYVERVASLDIEEYPQWDLNKELPKLPVPNVDVTLDKYLRCIRPLVGDSQYENTKRLVEKFRETVANDLQSELLDYANQVENWAFDFWLEDMYFKNKLALPVNSNPGMVFPRQNFPEKSDALRFAARLISGILDYKLVIDSKQLPVDRARHSKKGQPLCMEQYYRLFSTYRVPGVDKDSHLYTPSSGNVEPEHVIVACNNQLFPLYLKHNRSRLSVDNIYAQLKRIMTLADEGDANEEVGVLTSLQRDKWAECRLKLMEEPVNRRSLSLIENSIFILCIDHTLPATFNHQTTGKNRDDVSQALQMLHGLGSSFNSCNRWFDKTMQFIVCMDGSCGLNYEHSPAEGIAVVQLIEHLLKYMDELQKQKLCRLMSLTDLDEPQKLNWELKPEILDEIQLARNRIDKLIESLDLHILRFSDYGKEFVKSQNMSPDAFIQLALQLTYYKEYKKLVSTYESASIRRFHFGRVDNIRACSSEALDWVRAMVDEVRVSEEEKMSLFRRAMNRQTEILMDAILGYGIDNHLLALKRLSEEKNLGTPELFLDESYKMSNHFTLSTSQVPTTMDAFMCYGPVVEDGYGACYNPHPNYIVVVVSSFISCGETKSDRFAFSLQESFRQMKSVCLHNRKPLGNNLNP